MSRPGTIEVKGRQIGYLRDHRLRAAAERACKSLEAMTDATEGLIKRAHQNAGTPMLNYPGIDEARGALMELERALRGG